MRLRQVEQIVQVRAPFVRQQADGDGTVGGAGAFRLAAAGDHVEQTADQRGDSVLTFAGAEIEHQAGAR